MMDRRPDPKEIRTATVWLDDTATTIDCADVPGLDVGGVARRTRPSKTSSLSAREPERSASWDEGLVATG